MMPPPLPIGDHLRELPHTLAPAGDVIDVYAKRKAVPVILSAPVYNSRTGDEYGLPAETIKTVDGSPVPAGFRREGTRKVSLTYSIGAYIEPIDEKTSPC